MLYMSASAQSGWEQCFADDVQAICHMIAFFLFEKLPWQNLNCKNDEKNKKMVAMKNTCQKTLFGRYENYQKLYDYTLSLNFTSVPDYNLMKNFILDGNTYDELNFDWIVNQSSPIDPRASNQTIAPYTSSMRTLKNSTNFADVINEQEQILNKSPTIIVNNYSFKEKISTGKYSCVHLAHNPNGLLYAIKVEKLMPRNGLSKNNLLHEYNMYKKLSGEYKCTPFIHDYFEDKKKSYLVLELCGPDLMTIFKINCKNLFTTPCIKKIAHAVISIIECLQQANISHQDLKAENIVTSIDNKEPHLLLIGFKNSKM